MRIGKLIISKRHFKITVAIAVVLAAALFAAVFFQYNTLNPDDYYYTEIVFGLDTDVRAGSNIVVPLAGRSAAEIEELAGISPYPPYLPDGLTLSRAELVITPPTGQTDLSPDEIGPDYKAVRLIYTDPDNPDRLCMIMVSLSQNLFAKSDYIRHNEVSALSNSGSTGRYDTFADVDLLVYKFGGYHSYFTKFISGDHVWLVHCENMRKCDLRRIVCSIITGDPTVK